MITETDIVRTVLRDERFVNKRSPREAAESYGSDVRKMIACSDFDGDSVRLQARCAFALAAEVLARY